LDRYNDVYRDLMQRAGGTDRRGTDWHDLVVFRAANPWDGVRLHDQHIAERLARLRPVLYVDPPMSPLRRRGRPASSDGTRRPRLRVLSPSFAVLAPSAPPGPARPGIAALTEFLLRRDVVSAVGRLGGTVRTVIDASPMMSILGLFPDARDIFWAQDDYVGGAALFGYSAGRIARGERKQAAAADLIVTSSPVVDERWRSRGYSPILIPFGCDVDHFAGTESAPLPDDVDLPDPVVGFVGYINDRIDMRLFEEVTRRGRSLLVVGQVPSGFDRTAFDALLQRPNVQWVGPKRFDDLPSYLRVIDVGLVPYADSAFNRGSFPLKTLEYLSAGRRVVATDLPSTRWLDTELVRIESEPAAFADAVDDELARPGSAEEIEARRAFAGLHTWEQRAAAFADVL
jgi:glycosyltransferase involved in cell wall biosynthesis